MSRNKLTRTSAAASAGASNEGARTQGLQVHEQNLLDIGALRETTHANAGSRWLAAESIDVEGAAFESLAELLTAVPDGSGSNSRSTDEIDHFAWVRFIRDARKVMRAGRGAKDHVGSEADSAATRTNADDTGPSLSSLSMVTVYRPMAHAELRSLLTLGVLPATQPYQAIMAGNVGRAYSEKYLRGAKRVDTSPTNVVEFVLPEALLAALFLRQCKAEDGCMSHGLGNKAGRTVAVFNSWLTFAEGLCNGFISRDQREKAESDLAASAATSCPCPCPWQPTRDGSVGACVRSPTAAWRIVLVKSKAS
jgi:hypothetical protein